jgi:hypothetical protein
LRNVGVAVGEMPGGVAEALKRILG